MCAHVHVVPIVMTRVVYKLMIITGAYPLCIKVRAKVGLLTSFLKRSALSPRPRFDRTSLESLRASGEAWRREEEGEGRGEHNSGRGGKEKWRERGRGEGGEEKEEKE